MTASERSLRERLGIAVGRAVMVPRVWYANTQMDDGERAWWHDSTTLLVSQNDAPSERDLGRVEGQLLSATGWLLSYMALLSAFLMMTAVMVIESSEPTAFMGVVARSSFLTMGGAFTARAIWGEWAPKAEFSVEPAAATAGSEPRTAYLAGEIDETEFEEALEVDA